MTERQVIEKIVAQPASDGNGVKLLRVFGGPRPERFDPFLMLDEFGSDKASDYIGGFPSHPHRGFETVTYMLQGKMEHTDHLGNVGLLSDGGVQWMTAGKGVIHAEMPKQTEGRMRGFQLWVNLPAAQKMQPAHYIDAPADTIPEYHQQGVSIKAIAGSVRLNEEEIIGRFTEAAADPGYFDLSVASGVSISIPTPKGNTVLVYVYEGQLAVGEGGVVVEAQQLARFSDGDSVILVNSHEEPAKALLLSAAPIKEPIVQYGPFVMNSVAEIEQAMRDYRDGTLTAVTS